MLLSAGLAAVVVVISIAGVDASVVAGLGAVVLRSGGLDVSVREVMSSMAMALKSRAGGQMPGGRVELFPSFPPSWYQPALSQYCPILHKEQCLNPDLCPLTGS